MKLMFKQKFLSWFDSYDVFNENGETVYRIKGQLAWGHKFKVYDANNNELGEIVEKILTFLPKFEIYINGKMTGSIKKAFSILRPSYDIDFLGWKISGNIWEINYTILNSSGEEIAHIEKKIWKVMDTYELDIKDPANSLAVMMFVAALDAEKCSRK